jgi:hypothetical protein
MTSTTSYFSQNKFPKHLDQDEITEILNQTKAPEWYEAMTNTNIDF